MPGTPIESIGAGQDPAFLLKSSNGGISLVQKTDSLNLNLEVVVDFGVTVRNQQSEIRIPLCPEQDLNLHVVANTSS